jgi:hypothetical protein
MFFLSKSFSGYLLYVYFGLFSLIAEFEENNLLDRYEIVSRVLNESGKLVLSLILVPLVVHFNKTQIRD